jgi:16S rRNA (guanine1207-N2)-methyltransferase
MSQSRLSTVLADGTLTLPAGEVAVLRPPIGYDLRGLSREQVQIVHSFRPEIDAWQAAGYATALGMGRVAAAIVVIPRSKALARSLIAAASASAERVIVDGLRTDGIDALFKECRSRLGDLPSAAKAHGRIFWFAGTDRFADWAAPDLARGSNGYFTTAGVFSDGAVDRGSTLLAAAFPAKLPKRLADLGAGWGYLAAAALTRDGVQTVDLIEAEALSLNCAQLNITDPRASFHWADVTTFTPDRLYDAIIMNPPFHTGRAADPALGKAFIDAAARMLIPSGQIWMVANRHLPYEAHLRSRFRNVDEIGGDGAFKLFHAVRPLGPVKAGRSR